MTTLTIAQALATTASGITVADTPANIAQALSNSGLVARVSLFTLSGNGAGGAGDATALAGLGTRFSKNGFVLTVRDPIQSLLDPTHAAGVALATQIAVFDTAANLLSGASLPVVQHANSVLLSAGGSLTLANLATLESLPKFSILSGLTITLSDTAANLLAITAAQLRPAIKAYTVLFDSTVSAASAVRLLALPQFSIASGVHLVVRDTLANQSTSGMLAALPSLVALAGTTITIADSFAHLVAGASAITAVQTAAPGVTVSMTDSQTVTVTQVQNISASLPHFSVAPGQSLSVSDSVAHLVTLSNNVAAVAQAIQLAGNDTATAAQLTVLASLPHFSLGGHTLAVTDTVSALTALLPASLAFATSVTAHDSISNLLAAHNLPASVGQIEALYDAQSYSVAQAASLLALTSHSATLVFVGTIDQSLHIADTVQNLVTAGTLVASLSNDGRVSVTATDQDVTLSAASAATLATDHLIDPATYNVSVSDTGAALSAAAAHLFGQGFISINVTDGVFSGTISQLLDPSLHFGGQSGLVSTLAVPSAQLAVSTTVTAAQAVALSILPAFSLAPSVSLTVQDTITNVVDAASAIGAVATDVQLTDSESISAAGATILANIGAGLGVGHFDLGDNTLIVADTPSALIDPANAAGVALATSLQLSGDATTSASGAVHLLAFGPTLTIEPGSLTIIDTALHLAALANNPSALAAVNQWGGQVVVSADTTMLVAIATTLRQFTGFSAGSHVLTISDTAAHLLDPANSATIAAAGALRLSQDATLSVADATSLVSHHGFSIGGSSLTLRDTPLHLVMAPAETIAFAASETLAAQTIGNAADFILTAAQLNALLALPDLSAVGFSGVITVRDTASALAAEASLSFSGAAAVIAGNTVAWLSADATVSAATASTLAHLPGFDLNGHLITVEDSPGALLSLGAADGLAIANAVGISANATVSAATAAALAALPGFAENGNMLTVADTPANLAALSGSVIAITAIEHVLPFDAGNADAYTIDVGQLLSLAALPDLSMSGFTGAVTVSDTAANLASLASQFDIATPGSGLLIARAAIVASLSADATVSAAELSEIDSLPGISLAGHTLTVMDTPSALLAAFSVSLPLATHVVLASNAGPWTVSAANGAHLAGMPGFDTGSAGMVVVDTVQNILAANNAAGIAAAASADMSADSTVSAATATALHALPNFSLDGHHLTIEDSAAHLASLNAGTAALAQVIQLSGPGPVSVPEFNALRALGNFTTHGTLLNVAGPADDLLSLSGDLSLIGSTILSAPATVTADAAQALVSLPNLHIGDGELSIHDTVDALLLTTGAGVSPDDWAGEMRAVSIVLTADAAVSVAEANELGLLGQRFSTGGHTLIVEDAPSALAVTGAWTSIAAEIAGFSLAPSGSAWTVSAATATLLSQLPNFTTGPGLNIADVPASILAPENAAGLALAGTISLSANATTTVATAVALHAISNFILGGHNLTIADGGARLLALDSGTAAMATAIQLVSDSTVSVAEFELLRGLSNFSVNGHALTVSDSSAHLLTLTGDLSLITHIALDSHATLTASDAEALVTLAALHISPADLSISDTAGDLLATSSGPLPDDWAGELAAGTVTLTQDAVVTAAQATRLAMLGDRVSLGGHTLTISDTPSELVAVPHAPGLALATAVMLSASNVTVTTEMATKLAAISGFDHGGTVVTISDTADNLLLPGNGAILAFADHLQLSVAASISVAQASQLVGMAAFQVNAGAALHIEDTVGHLLHLGSTTLPHNNTLLQATPIGLAEDSIATVAQLVALEALPQFALGGHPFSLNGHALTIMDSGRHLAGFNPTGAPTGVTYVLSGDATLTAAQADALAAMSVDLDGNNLTIADTPAALLSIANAAGLAIADALTLSGNATTSASDAMALLALTDFSTGGHALTVQDTAAALLALDTTTKTVASSLALAASQTVDVATLAALSHLGTKFTLATHALTVSDTAAHLVTLNDQELALVSAQVLSTSATVGAATAEALVALPQFSLGGSVALTVQDTVANLVVLSNAVLTVAATERLAPGSNVTVTAAQAGELASLPHFTHAGATVTAIDTVAAFHSGGNAGWPAAVTNYVVQDSVAHLVAEGATTLSIQADLLTLSADSLVDAATLDALAALPNFDRGTAALIVVDSAAEIASHVAEVLDSASGARINDSAPITASEAEALVALQGAGVLSFSGSNHLAVEDSFANLADGANAGGLALASVVTVLDTATNIVSAAAHDWGTHNPFYIMSAPAIVSGAQALVLAGLGNHFSHPGESLSVAGTAAAVLGAASACVTLDVVAEVTDTAAHIGANAAALAAMGSTLASVVVTDATGLSAAAAAGLHLLSTELIGNSITVTDTAAAVSSHMIDLLVLETNLTSVEVVDTAAHIGAVSTGTFALTDLGSLLDVVVTDTAPVTAAVAVAIVPVLPYLHGGTVLDVSDTGASIAASAAALHTLGNVLGLLTLSDGTTTTASVAAALVPIDQHFGFGVALHVSDTAAAVSAAAAALTTLENDGRLADIHVSNETVAHVLAHAATLVQLDAIVTISDTAAAVEANLDALETFALHPGILQAIALTDGGTPTITVSIPQLGADTEALASITSGFHLNVSASAASIVADLGSGSSIILAHLSALTGIVASSGALSLTRDMLLATHIDDGAGSVLSKFSGSTISVTAAAVADLDTIASLGVVPDHVAVDDTVAHVAADLVSGSSRLVAHRSLLTAVAVDPAAVLTLTEAQVLAAHVDDGAGSILSLVSGATLHVTNVLVADIATILALGVAPSAIAVSDTAAHIQADLASGSSHLVAALSSISGITVTDSGTITLTEAQALAAHVDDGAGSVFAIMTGDTLHVTGVPVADIASVTGLGVPPSAITVSDTAAHIQADLASGSSALVSHAGAISSITANPAGTVTLTFAQVVAAGVDDGIGSALAKMSGVTLAVTNVAVANIDTALGLGVAPASIAVSDTAAHIQADLASGSSRLVADLSSISGITVSDAGTITLTESQVLSVHVDDGAGSVLAKSTGGNLVVTGVLVADVGLVAALGVAPSSMTVTGLGAQIQADLISGGSLLIANRGLISVLTNSDNATITLTKAQVLAAHVDDGAGSVLSKMAGGSLAVTGVAVADIDQILGLGVAPASIAVSDTAAHLQADLIAGGGTHILGNLSLISGITASDTGTITLTAAQILAAHVDDGIGSALAKMSGESLVVTQVAVAQINTIVALGVTPGHIAVIDTAAHIQADVTGGTSAILAHLAAITDIAINDSGTVTFSVAVATTAGVDDGAGSVVSRLSGGHFAISNALISDINTVVALPIVPESFTVSDTAAHIQADLAGGTSKLLAQRALISGIINSNAGIITLTEAQVLTAHVDDGVGSVLSKVSGGHLAVTGVLVANLDTVAGLAVAPSSIAVSDTAAHIQTDLALGGTSHIVANIGLLSGITVNPAGTITLTEAQALAAHIDDGVNSALALMTGETFVVTGVAVADIDTILSLGVPPASITVSDTAAHIQADLVSGSSWLLADHASITAITVADAGTITLSMADATAAGVDDGAGSVFAKTSGGQFAISNALISDISNIVALPVVPNSFSVSDTAAHIQADIAGGTSSLLAQRALISGITNSNAGTITLTATQALTAHVDDGAGSVFSKISGGALAVTGATVANIDAVAALGVVPVTIAVSDTAAHIQSDLASGSSRLVANIALLNGVTNSNAGQITLTQAQVLAAHVNDGAGSVLDQMSGGTLVVTNVLVADAITVADLGFTPASIAISDTAAHIQADLTSGASHILAVLGDVSAITVSDAGTIALTTAQILAVSVDDFGGSALAKTTGGTLVVTDVTVADIATILGLGVAPSSITVSDTAAHVQADLALGGASVIIGNTAHISSVILPSNSTITLTGSQAVAAGIGVALNKATNLSTFAVTGATVAQISTVAGLGVANTTMTVSDTAAHVQSDLVLGGTSAILASSSLITGISVPSSSTITLTEAQAVYAGVAAALALAPNVTTFIVTGVTVAQISTVLGLGVTGTHMTISDTQAHVQADLTSGSPVLVAQHSAINSITLTGSTTLTMTIAQISAASSALNLLGTWLLAVNDTAAHIQDDLALGGSSMIVTRHTHVTSITVPASSTITLTESQAVAAFVAGALRIATGLTTFNVTGVTVAQVSTVLALAVTGTVMAISDSASNVQTDLALGNTSVLVSHAGAISGIQLTGGTTITLTEAQAVSAGVATALNLVSNLTSFAVTGVTVAQIATVAGLGVAHTAMAISDTAAHVQTDLALSGSSQILTNAASISGIALPATSTITLTESQAVFSGVAAALSGATNLTSFVVTGVTVAQVATVMGLNVPNTTMTIVDTAGHVQADLVSGGSQILAQLDAVNSITVSPGGTITLTAAQVTAVHINDGAGSALSKISGETLVVTDVAVADIATILALGVPPDSITISDTAAHIQADLTSVSSAILGDLVEITSIVVSDAGTVTLTPAQAAVAGVDDGVGSAISLLSGGHFVVSGALVSDLDTVAALPVVPETINVSDTAAHLQSDLVSGSPKLLAHRTLLGVITNSNAGTITLTSAQVTAAHVDDGAGSVLSKVSGGNLTVTGVLVADVGTIATLGVAPTSFTVSDTAAHISADLASGSPALLANRALISAITNNNAGTITLTETQILAAHVDDGAGSVLSKVSGGGIGVTGVLAADVDTIAGLAVAPTFILVSDTAAHLQADLVLGAGSHLLNNLGIIVSIAVAPSGTITLTEAQAQYPNVDDGGGSALDKLLSGGTLVVTGVPVADIATILGLDVAPEHITILDTAANLIADLEGGSSVITANVPQITAVKPTNGTLNVATATSLYNDLIGLATFDESALTISDTAANLLTAHGSIPALLSAAAHVTLTNNPVNMTAANATILSGILGGVLGGGHTLQIVDTAAHLLDSNNAAGVLLATDTALSAGLLSSASYITSLAGVHAFNANGQTIVIQDTLTSLLNTSYLPGIAVATQVVLDTNYTTTAAQLTTLAGLHSYSAGAHDLTVQDTAANIGALSQPALGFAAQVHVSDTSANVSAAINTLQSVVTAHSHPLTITLSDGVAATVSITMTSVTYSTDAATVDTITTAGSVRVLGTASQLAAIASTLAADTVVGEVDVSDTAANILSNLTTLNSIGAKFLQATISDVTINASQVAALLGVPHLVASGLTISDTGSQIAAAIEANGAPGLTFMNAHTVELSGDSVVTAAEALDLETLTSLTKNGHTLKVWDTASHLTDSIDGYLAAVNAALIDGVYLKTTGGTATVSGSTAAILVGITNFSKNNPGGGTNTLIVQDTAAHLESAFSTLSAHLGLLNSIVVSASATITDAVLAHLLTLGATTAGGVAITVRDTAVNIATNAPGQLAGSLTPTTWSLAGSATVTEAQAAILGGLGGFSAGAFTLTLSADASGVSVADANKLGVLGSAFHLGGHLVHVAGSVSTVSGLSSNAKLVVTPDITDTFAHVATLTQASNLLGGTITVTDSEAVSVAQASSFLDLLKVGGGPGIPAANVAFGGHVESVTDTLSNIQSLTGSAGWTDNNSVHADFNLVVADTIANLINGANTATLATMNGTTFAANQTATAANAETLAGLTNTIHFTKGSFTLTISDTPAHLLDPGNVDGESLADTWQLSANATVSAADAETLLTTSKFHLNHTLTVSDTSDSLLDGVLTTDISGSPYSASVHVQLSGAETLDAQTAAQLVALPGYTDTGALSIQDGSVYLLNSANHAAEVLAASVTLAGDETVSAATAARLEGLPNFDIGSNHVFLASNDFADTATLRAIADLDTGFDPNGHTLSMTQDTYLLTPTEYTSLQADNVQLNGHVLSALATGISVTSAAGSIHVVGDGINGATLNIYAASGSLLSSTGSAATHFDATDTEVNAGNGLVVTEVVGGSAATSESAPIIALERSVLTTEATNDGATFAGSGQVQVNGGQFVNLYTTANAPAHPTNPALVYDSSAHTLSLAIDGHSPLVLVTLGAATHPASLDPSEIFIRHFT